jgi:hypothetical protein
MQAYKFMASGVLAIMMAENDEAVMKKCFGHLEKVRVSLQEDGDYASFDEPRLVCHAGIWRLGKEQDEVVTHMEVWTDEVKFIPPEGAVQ